MKYFLSGDHTLYDCVSPDWDTWAGPKRDEDSEVESLDINNHTNTMIKIRSEQLQHNDHHNFSSVNDHYNLNSVNDDQNLNLVLDKNFESKPWRPVFV